MVQFLLKRPIAVLLSFLGGIIFSLISLQKIPVSLLPPLEVPQLVIQVNAPNTSQVAIEKNILSLIRENMLSMEGITDIETVAYNEGGKVVLNFEYLTPMELTYIDANERVDRLTELLPRGTERPQITRINASDIPVMKIHVTPENGVSFTQLSAFVENTLKKRVEQINGVSLVDLNGLVGEVIAIRFFDRKIAALHMTKDYLIQAIRSANQNLGGISVRDGQYRYFIKVENTLIDGDQISNLPIRLPTGTTISLKELAEVKTVPERTIGSHFYNGQRAIVLNVHKQQTANMLQLVSKVEEALKAFKKDYPFLSLSTSGNQSTLLELSLDNLRSSLLYGGIFAFIILFLFFKDFRLPLVMGISLPITLTLCFLFFFLFNVSINIISLSGLALGIGMLIDNAIIVVDNITQKRAQQITLFQSCVAGVNEIIPALISSVLTTLAVFAPLVFLSGITGALFVDQAIAVTIILVLSLLVAFILVPMLYWLLFQKSGGGTSGENPFFTRITQAYHWFFQKAMRFKWLTLLLFLLSAIVAFWGLKSARTEGLPTISQNEKLLKISWNEPINLLEQENRTLMLLQHLSDLSVQSNADLGISQYLLDLGNSSPHTGKVHLEIKPGEDFETKEKIFSYLSTHFPRATFTIGNAPNAFEQLFQSEAPYFEARFNDPLNKSPLEGEQLQRQFKELAPSLVIYPEKGFAKETIINLTIDTKKLATYDISQQNVREQLNQSLGQHLITELKNYGSILQVVGLKNYQSLNEVLENTYAENSEQERYPLSTFVNSSYESGFKNIYANKTGTYQSVAFEASQPIASLIAASEGVAKKHNYQVNFSGAFFTNQQYLKDLSFILMISVLLLYFILAAQFESFLQPLIVLLTVPIAIAGALILLMMTDSTLNIMSAIGMVVMVGIIVNDSILKIDTINRLIKTGMAKEEAISAAGLNRLKPILMTSITTILALAPIIFFEGIGAELQLPLVLSVSGGLLMGTIASLFMIPVLYQVMVRR